MIHRLLSHALGADGLLGTRASAVDLLEADSAVSADVLVQRDSNGDVLCGPGVAAGHPVPKSVVDAVTPVQMVHWLEEFVVTSDVTSFDFAFSANGDSDGGYIILGRYTNAGALALDELYLRLNGALAVGSVQQAIFDSASISASRASGSVPLTRLAGGSPSETGLTHSFSVIMPCSVSGFTRQVFATSSRYRADLGGVIRWLDIGSLLTTPASGVNITSLGVSSNRTGGIGAGSRFHLGRLAR